MYRGEQRPYRHWRGPVRWGGREWLFLGWVGGALAAMIAVPLVMSAALPIIGVVELALPLLAVLLSRDARTVGFRGVPGGRLLGMALLVIAGNVALGALVEPWSHAYQALVRLAVAAPVPDSTFAWLVRFPGGPGWAGLLIYSGLVTIFAEELCFRGWLLQLLGRHMVPWAAIGLQALLFTAPQGLAAWFLTPLQGGVYLVVYSFLSVGVIGGWAAWRTGSIWPSLIAATLGNLLASYAALNGWLPA